MCQSCVAIDYWKAICDQAAALQQSFPELRNFVLTAHSFHMSFNEPAWQQHDVQELCRVMFDALESKFKNTDQVNVMCHTNCMQERSKAKVTYYFLKCTKNMYVKA